MKGEEKKRSAEEVARKNKRIYERNAQFGGIWRKVKFGALYLACVLLVLTFLSFFQLAEFILK